MTRVRPIVAISAGDPSGIGPEIVVKALRDPRVIDACQAMVFGAIDETALESFPAGRVDASSGRAAHDAIVEATAAVRDGRADALVTAPIHKGALAAAGFAWRGHTDLLAHLCGADQAAMMFWSERLSVVLATVHIALRDVADAITTPRLVETIRLTARALPEFGVASPRIGVAGLNPHAGEQGLMGREDADIIRPAVEQAAALGCRVSGPWPADTLFVRAVRGEFDVVIAQYHDQGLVPVKLLAFGRAVNVTLGLPIIRTSVDHGTAFDIARQGVADESSLVEAILLAARLAARRIGLQPRE